MKNQIRKGAFKYYIGSPNSPRNSPKKDVSKTEFYKDVFVILDEEATKPPEKLEGGKSLDFSKIVEQLCEKYPLITIDDTVIGEPRLTGTRFGVSDVLSAFCMYDSIDEIIAEYEDRYSEEQLKDAVRFARDFLDAFYTTS